MATLAELNTRREALAASRVTEQLDREIATLEGRRIVRHVRVTTSKGL